jgi:hypothetical protein
VRSCVFVGLLVGCKPDDRPPSQPDAGCDEPDPRDPKGLADGDPCESSFQCNSPYLHCMGAGPGAQATCTSQTSFTNERNEVIELWDSGCYPTPQDAALGHCSDPKGSESNAIPDVVACDGTLVTYEIPDTCCWNGTQCTFDCTDFQRREVWRNCGCCWRLVELVERAPEYCRGL